jgi:uncharacterized membrane protein YtjA (UPF0391 family)
LHMQRGPQYHIHLLFSAFTTLFSFICNGLSGLLNLIAKLFRCGGVVAAAASAAAPRVLLLLLLLLVLVLLGWWWGCCCCYCRCCCCAKYINSIRSRPFPCLRSKVSQLHCMLILNQRCIRLFPYTNIWPHKQ